MAVSPDSAPRRLTLQRPGAFVTRTAFQGLMDSAANEPAGGNKGSGAPPSPASAAVVYSRKQHRVAAAAASRSRKTSPVAAHGTLTREEEEFAIGSRTLTRESSFKILDTDQGLRGRARTLKRMTQGRRTTLLAAVDWTRPGTWTLPSVRAKTAMEPLWACTQDEDGRLPLHSVAGAVRNVDILRHVISCFPPAALHRDKHGFFPLHFAAYENRSTAVVSYLLKLFLGTVAKTTHDGSFPLHLAAERNSNAEVVEVLTTVMPEALHVADSHGWLPLHR